jgi:molybdopterin converting factor small subunit
MKCRIRCFAVAKKVTQRAELEWAIPAESCVRDIRQRLLQEFPLLQDWLPQIKIAVNGEYVSEDYHLSENDELALIPPVSGG